MRINGFILLISFSVLLIFNGCKKSPLDYRNKWVGEWHFEVEFSSSSSFGVSKYEEDGHVDFGDETRNEATGKAIEINGRTYGVERDGSIHDFHLRTGSSVQVGSIDKKELSISESNSSAQYGESWIIKGTRIK